MKMRMMPLWLAATLWLVGSADPARAAVFTTWTGFTPTTATGTIADPGGPIAVNLAITNGVAGDAFSAIENSSTYGTFGGNGQTVADIYEPNPPGTSDFLRNAAQSNGALYTLTFSSPVVDPVFHVFNMDFRAYTFLGGITPTFVSGLNIVTSGNTAMDPDGNGTTGFDNGLPGDPNKGAGNDSGYGSFLLTGTFSTIQWNRPLVPNGFFSDGGTLGVSAEAADVAAVPEPATLTSAAIAGLMGLGASWRRRKRAAA